MGENTRHRTGLSGLSEIELSGDTSNSDELIDRIFNTTDSFSFESGLEFGDGSVFVLKGDTNSGSPKKLVWDKDRNSLHGISGQEYITSFPVDTLRSDSGREKFSQFINNDFMRNSKPTGVWEVYEDDEFIRDSELLFPHIARDLDSFELIESLPSSGGRSRNPTRRDHDSKPKTIFSDGNLTIEIDKDEKDKNKHIMVKILQDHARNLASLPVEHNTLSIVVTKDLRNSITGKSVLGLVSNYDGGNTMYINRRAISKRKELNEGAADSGSHVDFLEKYGTPVYALVHEFGHVLDLKNGRTRHNSSKDYGVSETRTPQTGSEKFFARMRSEDNMTEYGKTNVLEGYAEAWVAWYFGGKGHNPVSDAYAEKYGWEEITGGVPADVAMGISV